MSTTPPVAESEALLARIEAYDFPGGSAAFAQRLARDNQWTEAYALAVLAEYRRFLYLMATAGTRLAPSHAVDAAWHLHLVHTQAYWDDFCPNIIGRPLHHHPSLTEADSARDADAFATTLALYEQTFGQKPPRHIWQVKPLPRIPIEPKLYGIYRRETSLVVPKVWFWLTTLPLAGLITLLALSIPPALTTPFYVLLGLLGLMIVVAIVAAQRKRPHRGDGVIASASSTSSGDLVYFDTGFGGGGSVIAATGMTFGGGLSGGAGMTGDWSDNAGGVDGGSDGSDGGGGDGGDGGGCSSCGGGCGGGGD